MKANFCAKDACTASTCTNNDVTLEAVDKRNTVPLDGELDGRLGNSNSIVTRLTQRM